MIVASFGIGIQENRSGKVCLSLKGSMQILFIVLTLHHRIGDGKGRHMQNRGKISIYPGERSVVNLKMRMEQIYRLLFRLIIKFVLTGLLLLRRLLLRLLGNHDMILQRSIFVLRRPIFQKVPEEQASEDNHGNKQHRGNQIMNKALLLFLL